MHSIMAVPPSERGYSRPQPDQQPPLHATEDRDVSPAMQKHQTREPILEPFLPERTTNKPTSKREKNRKEDKAKQVYELYRGGMSYAEVAEAMGFGLATARNYVSIGHRLVSLEAGEEPKVRLRGRSPDLPPKGDREKEAYLMRRAGKSDAEIAAEMQISVDTMRNYASAGKKIVAEERRQQTRQYKAYQLHTDGKTDEEIAREMGITVQSAGVYITNERRYLAIEAGQAPRRRVIKPAPGQGEQENRYEQAYRLYQEGKTDTEIAEEMKLSNITVKVYITTEMRRIAREKGEEPVRRERARPAARKDRETRSAQAYRLSQEGKTDEEIAGEMGISAATAQTYIKQEHRRVTGKVSPRRSSSTSPRRLRGRKQEEEDTSDATSKTSPSATPTQFDRDQAKQLIAETPLRWAALDPTERELVIARDTHVPFSEIADLLGVSVAQARAMHRAAQEKLVHDVSADPLAPGEHTLVTFDQDGQDATTDSFRYDEEVSEANTHEHDASQPDLGQKREEHDLE